MQTRFVNPANPTRTRTRGGVIVVRANGAMANPRRRRRRRNAAPLIMPNPRRRSARRPVVVVANPRRRSARRSTIVVANPRRRRRNPNGTKDIIKNVAIGGGMALGSYLLNKYAIGKISLHEGESLSTERNRTGMLVRIGIRAVLAGLSAAFLPGSIGAAGMGALLYPAISEADNWWATRPQANAAPPLPPPTGTQADLEADLNAALYGY